VERQLVQLQRQRPGDLTATPATEPVDARPSRGGLGASLDVAVVVLLQAAVLLAAVAGTTRFAAEPLWHHLDPVPVRTALDPAYRADAANLLAAVVRGGSIPTRTPSGVFRPEELDHLRDVQAVLGGLHRAAVVACILGALGLALARRAGRLPRVLRLLRTSAIATAAGAALLGLVAAAAWRPTFRLLHRLLFPDGNWRFPADGALAIAYPLTYFRAATVAIGLALVTALLAQWGIATLLSGRIRSAGCPTSSRSTSTQAAGA